MHAPPSFLPLQVAAVAQALLLLDASREESEDVALALLAAKHEEHLVTSPHSSAASAHTAAAADGDAAGDAGQGEDVHGSRDDAGASSLVGMSAAVSRADMRAEEVSHMARCEWACTGHARSGTWQLLGVTAAHWQAHASAYAYAHMLALMQTLMWVMRVMWATGHAGQCFSCSYSLHGDPVYPSRYSHKLSKSTSGVEDSLNMRSWAYNM